MDREHRAAPRPHAPAVRSAATDRGDRWPFQRRSVAEDCISAGWYDAVRGLKILDIAAVIAAGFLATLAMTVTGYLLGAGGLTYFDLDELLARRIASGAWAPGLGVLLHFVVGTVLVAVYVLLWDPAFGGPPLVSGATFGVAEWLLAMLVIMPSMGRGLFAWELGWRVPAALLVSHLVYGVAVALLYSIFALP